MHNPCTIATNTGLKRFYAQPTYNCNQCEFEEICMPTSKHSRSSPSYEGRQILYISLVSCELKSKEIVFKLRRKAMVLSSNPGG